MAKEKYEIKGGGGATGGFLENVGEFVDEINKDVEFKEKIYKNLIEDINIFPKKTCQTFFKKMDEEKPVEPPKATRKNSDPGNNNVQKPAKLATLIKKQKKDKEDDCCQFFPNFLRMGQR